MKPSKTPCKRTQQLKIQHLRFNDATTTRTSKKNKIGLISKTTTLHVHHPFLYIYLRSLHDYDEINYNLTFCGRREHKTTTLFCFSWFWYSPLESNYGQIRQHLTNWTRWNKRDEVWASANTLFNWRFGSPRRCCLSSLFRQELPKLLDWHVESVFIPCCMFACFWEWRKIWTSSLMRCFMGDVNTQRQIFLSLNLD